MVDQMALAVGPAPHAVAATDALLKRFGNELEQRLRGGPVVRGSHARILEAIGEAGSRPSVLAAGWITKQAVGQRLRELQDLGLVRLDPDPGDGRAVLAFRTPAGQRALDDLHATIAAVEESFAAVVGSERYAVFRAVLAELVDH